MKIKRTFYLLSIGLILVCCSKSETERVDPINSEQENNNSPEVEVPIPKATTLIFPEDKTECNEGVVLDETWSVVNFQWNPAPDTDYYELVYKINGSNESFTEKTTQTELEVRILRGTQYQWSVISKSNQLSIGVSSDAWNFYNEGTRKRNYTPFPATLINPKNEEIINLNNSESYYYFEWDTIDLDDDTLTYDLYLGTHPDSLVIAKTLTEKRELLSNHIDHGKKYYWQIKTTDAEGSSSLSEVWSFMRF